jgi:hypothetical protein
MHLLLTLALSLLAAMGANAQDPKKTAAILTGDSKGAASNNPQCKLFTPAEAAKYVGKPVGAGQNAGMGTGCQWATKDYEGDMMVTVVPAQYHEEPKLAKGYQPQPALGTKGFVAPEMGGWTAGVIKGSDAIRVSLVGPAASEKAVLDLLQETLKRRGK